MATVTRTSTGAEGTRSLLRSIGGMVFGSGISAIANFLLIVVLARLSDPSTVGVLLAGTSVFLILVVVARLGTPAGLVYHIARARALVLPDQIRRSIVLSVLPVVILSVLVATSLWVTAPSLASLLAGSEPLAGVEAMLRILAVMIPVAALFEVFLAVLEGFRKMAPTASLDRVLRPLLQLGAVTLVAAPQAIERITVGWVAPYLPVMVVAAIWAWWVVRRSEEVTDDDTPLTRSAYWRFTVPRWASSMLQVCLQRLDIFLVAVLAGPVEAAVYGTATRAIVVGQMSQQAVGQVVQPRFGEALAVHDRAEAQALYTTSTSWLVLLTWPVFLGISLLSVPFLEIFGSDYTDGWPVIVILSAALLIATSSGVVDIVLTMSGRSALALANAALAVVGMLAVDVVAIPALGAVGAAVGWATSILLRTVLPLWQVHHDIGLHPYHIPNFRSMGWTLLLCGFLPLGVALAGGWSLGSQLVGVALGLCALLGYVVIRRHVILAWPEVGGPSA